MGILGENIPSCRPCGAEITDHEARGLPVSIVIAHDDRGAARELQAAVTEVGHAVVAVVHSPIDLINAGLRHRPDLVLAAPRLDGEATAIAVSALMDICNLAAILLVDDQALPVAAARPPFRVSMPCTYDPLTLQRAIRQAHSNVPDERSLPVFRLGTIPPRDMLLRLDTDDNDTDPVGIGDNGRHQSRPTIPVVIAIGKEGSDNSAKPADPGRLRRISSAVRHAGTAVRDFMIARAKGIGASFTGKLDKEIGETVASALVTLTLAASTPLLAIVLHLPSEVTCAGPALAALRLLRPR